MTLENLRNLAKIGELNEEPADQNEFDGLLRSGADLLNDVINSKLSESGRFDLAYNAAHALALAALRFQGYRSGKRYMVFQCLTHTVGLDKAKTRILILCHDKRNLAAYRGRFEVAPQLTEELIEITSGLLTLVEKLGPIKQDRSGADHV